MSHSPDTPSLSPDTDPHLQTLISHYSTTSSHQDLIIELYHANACNYLVTIPILNRLFCGEDAAYPSSIEPLSESIMVLHAPEVKKRQKRKRNGRNAENGIQKRSYIHPKILKFLQDIFPEHSEQLVRNILSDANGDLKQATETLLSLSGSMSGEASFSSTENVWEKPLPDASHESLPQNGSASNNSPSLTDQQRQIVASLVEMFPFITEERIARTARELDWNESRIWGKLSHLQERMQKGENIEDEDTSSTTNNTNLISSAPGSYDSHLQLNMDFPSLNNNQSNIPTVDDVKHIQNCVDQLHALFGKRVGKEMVSQVFAQCSHSFSRAKEALIEIFPLEYVEQEPPKSIVGSAQEDEVEQQDTNSATNVYTKGWQKIKKKPRTTRTTPRSLSRDDLGRYEKLMRDSYEVARERGEAVLKAITSYRSGDIHNAQRYSQEATDLRQQVSQLQSEAYRILHRSNPRDVVDASLTILDLHGYATDEACSLFLKHHAAMKKLGTLLSWQCITGKGIHSHKRQAKLRPAIIKLCDSRMIRYRERHTGILEVFV